MIRFSGDIRRDFDKATAEISKLKDRILGYQEKISNLVKQRSVCAKPMPPKKKNMKRH